MCPGGITTLQGCEQAVGQLLLPAATVLDRNSYSVIYPKPLLLPGPRIMLTLVAMFNFSLHFCIYWILLSWIPDVKALLVPCVVLDECQKVAAGVSLYLPCILSWKMVRTIGILPCNLFYSLIYQSVRSGFLRLMKIRKFCEITK